MIGYFFGRRLKTLILFSCLFGILSPSKASAFDPSTVCKSPFPPPPPGDYPPLPAGYLRILCGAADLQVGETPYVVLDPAYAPPTPVVSMPLRTPRQVCGSVIQPEDQTVGEIIPVAGTPFNLTYFSDRNPGRTEAYVAHIKLTPSLIPANVQTIAVSVSIAGRIFTNTLNAAPNLSYDLFGTAGIQMVSWFKGLGLLKLTS